MRRFAPAFLICLSVTAFLWPSTGDTNFCAPGNPACCGPGSTCCGGTGGSWDCTYLGYPAYCPPCAR